MMPYRTMLDATSQIDPVRLAEAVPGPFSFIFQRFDLGTRHLRRSVVGLAVEPVGEADFESSLRRGLDRSSGDRLLVFAGAEALAGSSARAPGDFPNHLVLRLKRYLEFDHDAGTVALVADDAGLDAGAVIGELEQGGPAPSELPSRASSLGWQHDADFGEYRSRLELIRTAATRGDIEGAVLSLGLSRPTTAPPFSIYRRLVAANPSPYCYLLRADEHALLGCSPLAFLQTVGRRIHLETDAGTRQVTGNRLQDEAAAADLAVNPKDAAEHAVVVEAERDALSAIAREGQVRLAIDRQVRRFSHVMHLYSALEAELDSALSLADAVLALAPAAAVSGRPKRVAAELGVAAEQGSRGPYGGVIGLIDPRTGEGDLAVVIRSLWISGGTARLRVGGKIVAASDPEAEYRECLAKATFLVEGVAAAEASTSTVHA